MNETSCCKSRSLKSEKTKYEIISDPLKNGDIATLYSYIMCIYIYIYIHTHIYISSGNFLKVIQICLGSRNF